MSIINDALKKTQVNFRKQEPPPVPAQEKKPQEKPEEKSLTDVYKKLYQKKAERQTVAGPGNAPKAKEPVIVKATLRPAKKWSGTVITAVAFLAVVSGIFLFVKSIKNRSRPESRSYVARRAPKQRAYRPGELVLNGTSLIDGKRVALINDEIYEIGEIVDGKRITSIELNQIELADKEKVITLRVH